MALLPHVCLLTESHLTKEVLQRYVTASENITCSFFDNSVDLLRYNPPSAPAAIILDVKTTNQTTSALLESIQKNPLLANTPICLTYSLSYEPFVREACALYDNLVYLSKPLSQEIFMGFLQNAKENILLPIVVKNISPKAVMPELLKQRIQNLPGVVQSFTWTDRATVQNYPTPESRTLGDTLSYCMEICAKLGEESGFGELIEIHVQGETQAAAFFSVNTPQNGKNDFTAVGLLINNQYSTKELVQEIRRIGSANS